MAVPLPLFIVSIEMFLVSRAVLAAWLTKEAYCTGCAKSREEDSGFPLSRFAYAV
jgi:hypothetical protein